MGVLVDITISNVLGIKTDVWIDATAQCRVVVKSNDLKRRCGRGVEAEFVGQRQHIKYGEAATHRSFSVLERIP